MRFLILTHDADRFRQEIYLHGLNLEFENLKSADIVESVTSAQATTTTLYKDWQDIKVAELTPQSRLSNFLSLAKTQREKLESQMAKKKESEKAALKLYFNQGERRNSDYSINLMWA